MQAHLTRETTALSPYLQHDFKKMLALAPRLLEELMKVLVLVHICLWCGFFPAFFIYAYNEGSVD